MKRFTRRTLAVVAGLALGWCAAGMVPLSWPVPQRSMAQDSPPQTTQTAPAAEEAHRPAVGDLGAVQSAAQGAGHAAGEFAGGDHGPGAAAQLVPHEDTSWYRCVIACAAGLFSLALLIGLAYKFLGISTTPPPEPAAHDDHDDHAHATGEAAHGGHHEPVAPGSHAGAEHKPHGGGH